MRIVHFTSAHGRYDIRIFHKMCVSLAAIQHDTYLVVSDTKGDEIKNGVKIISAGVQSKSRFKRMLTGAYKTYQKAKEIPADIYHFHDPELIPFGLIMALKGKKVIFDSHEDIPKDILDKAYMSPMIRKIASYLFALLEKFFFQKFAIVISATDSIKNKFISFGVKSEAVNNYPLLSEFNEASNVATDNICYIGGINQIRGIEELIDALNYTEGAQLILAGTFDDSDFERRMKEKKGWSKVDFRGQVNRNEISQILKNSSIGIVTYLPAHNHLQALPNKMFEYLAAGLPVIVSNFTLWREIVEDNKCGRCVNPHDSKDIASKINEMLSDRDSLIELGKIGMKLTREKYNWEQESKKLVEIYNNIHSVCAD